ncbi:Zn(II)2Cys6 transcription factor domain-containing protein [Aspergillus alliaceus]|uniref:Zn(II)2Cys6 transcription factor domain-containing protein n=1 Tax=Petromyces alliaceus TaxID=209559 RepID=UPI0012A67780|nr:uncharacterized protein BDW43DRAFT_307207 [Aspergillus alliaceus]KAB8237688.1 hypothetical protein BDW43DRAFT_307207 [Aspergillus alliaceus]
MPPDSYLSMRASCNRCRFHKLKCVVNSEGNSGRHECARCIRAKVECVYSQRARAKRQKTVGSGATSRASSKEDSGPFTPSTGPPSAREEDFGDVDSSRTSSSEIRAIWSTPDSGPRPDRHAHSLSTFGGLAQDQTDVPAVSTGGPLTSLPLDTAPHQSLSSRHIPQSVPQQVCQDLGLGSSITLPRSMRERRQPQAYGNLDNHLTSPASQLSNLVADIHKTLALLTADCRGSKCPSFNFREYPIGTVLHLAQDLIDIVSKFKPAREAPTIPWEPVASDISTSHTTWAHYTTAASSGSDSPISSLLNQDFFYPDLTAPSPPLSSTPRGLDNVLDTPTKLLAKGCYFSLRRLYYLVFTHFEGYLSTLWQAPSSRGLLAHNLARGRRLQVGELLSADEMCSGIDTAVRLMLEILQSAEDVLNHLDAVGAARGIREADPCRFPMSFASKGQDEPSLVNGELGRGFADQATMPVHSELDGLGSKVQSLRGMLKERMRWVID